MVCPKIHICFYFKNPGKGIVIDTTSRSKSWSIGLSPFYLGPINLYNNYISETMENAWQYTKVYKEHLDSNGMPNENYWKWAKEGWESKRAVRYPKGKGAIPEFSFWKNEKLDYIQARKKIYIPLYSESIVKTEAFSILKDLYLNSKEDIWLKDFDAYDEESYNMTLQQVADLPSKKMGHAFILKALLQNYIIT